MNQIKVAYQKQEEEECDEGRDNPITGNENQGTHRSSIMEDLKSKDTQFNHSYINTYTQGNMTTNSNIMSTSKADLNMLNAKYKSSSSKKFLSNAEYPLDSNDAYMLSNDNNERGRQNEENIKIEMQSIVNGLQQAQKANCPGYKAQILKKNLQIEIPDSDEERKVRQELQAKIQNEQILKNQNNKPSESEKLDKNLPNSPNVKGDNPESSRVDEIIKHNQLDVENLQTIQIDYDFETIEGLTDDQCLELYCEGSVKLKNSSRLYCKVGYEQLLVEKIRSTTRLVYSNLGILNSGNLSSQEFIPEAIVSQLKLFNSKYKATDISEAFTVQCSDYIHFNLRKTISMSINISFFLSLISIITFILKFQDSTYQQQIIPQILCVAQTLIQLISTYFFSSGIYSCNNDNIRRGLMFNILFFIINITSGVIEGIVCNYFKNSIQNKLHTSDNFHQLLFYIVGFLINLILPCYLRKQNINTPTAVRKIVKIVSDEFID